MKDIYTLSNFVNYSNEINPQLNHTQRIKYTCFNASNNYLALGASSGSLYLFQRKPCKLLQLVPSKYRSITNIIISPNEHFVAFVTQKNVICVFAINLGSNSVPELITTSVESNNYDYDSACGKMGNDIQISSSQLSASISTDILNLGLNKCLQWSSDEKQFFYGNHKGEVYLVTLNTFFVGKSLINLTVHPILFLDSPIVQISEFESLLLVSNLTKCILCNMEYEEYKQIGNQPRDGYYGACFAIQNKNDYLSSRIYCARPGSRIWEINLEGNVIQTHEFKNVLNCKPTSIYNDDGLIDKSLKQMVQNDNDYNSYKPKSLQFSKLQTINEAKFIFTYTDNGIYILDPKDSSVILWTDKFNGIIDCVVIGNEIIIFTNSGDLYAVSLQTIQSLSINLIYEEKMLQCIQILLKNLKYFTEKVKENCDLWILDNIRTYLIQQNQYELLNNLSVLFDCLSAIKQKTSLSSELQLNQSYEDNLINIKQQSFGKDIKSNIFNDGQKNLVEDLMKDEKKLSFEEICKEFKKSNEIYYENDYIGVNFDESSVICDRTRIQKSTLQEQIITEEEKSIYNLYLIWKTSKISNTTFLDRYRKIFDKYTSKQIIELLSKLEKVMEENCDNSIGSKKDCYEMYLSYLKPEMLWEFDITTCEYITNAFIFVNSNAYDDDGKLEKCYKNDDKIVTENIYCNQCEFPIQFTTKCCFREIGETLFKFYQSRNEQKLCQDLIKNVPSLIDVYCRYLFHDPNQFEKIIAMTLNYGDLMLLNEVSQYFNANLWQKCFNLFSNCLQGKFTCPYCNNIVLIETKYGLDKNEFYTWENFLNNALKFLEANEILGLLLKHSHSIPSNCIKRKTFIRCLLK